MLISGRGLGERDERGDPVGDDDLLLLLNANEGEVPFPLPSGGWQVLVDTSRENSSVEKTYLLQGRSLALLSRPRSRAPARTGA